MTHLIQSGLLTQVDLRGPQVAGQVLDAPVGTRPVKQAILDGHQNQAVAHAQLEGVSHQLRPMLLGIGHPVAGDKAVKVHRQADFSVGQTMMMIIVLTFLCQTKHRSQDFSVRQTMLMITMSPFSYREIKLW